MPRTLIFLTPLIITTIIFIVFTKSFPSIGECGMAIIGIVPFLFICSLAYGWLCLNVRRLKRWLIAFSVVVFSLLLFIYPVTCDDSPFSTLADMARILTNKSSITYADRLGYPDREKKLAAIKKFDRELSPDKFYEVEIKRPNSNTLKETIIYFKDDHVYCIDSTFRKSPNLNELYTVMGTDTIKIFFDGFYIDAKKMNISASSYIQNDQHESYPLTVPHLDVEIRIRYDDEEWHDAYSYKNYWAYRIFYWLF